MLQLSDYRCTSGSRLLLHIDAIGIAPGQFVALVGPNGAGKSTLLKCLAGDLPARGRAELWGRDLRHWPRLPRARQLAVLPQASQLGFPFHARDVVALGATPLAMTRAEVRRQTTRFMRDCDCLALADRPFTALSGGEQQRVHLARVLLQLSQARQPPLLLLDEPTSAQDLGQQHHMLSYLRAFCDQRGGTVIAVLHDLNQVLRYCDRCVLLVAGQRKALGEPARVLTPDAVEAHWRYRPHTAEVDGQPVLA